MKMHSRDRKYLLSGRHGFFSSRFIRVFIAFFALLVLFSVVLHIRKTRSFLPSVSSLYSDWNAQAYQSVYENSGLILNKRPLDGAVLALRGFSAYYLFAAQNDPAAAQTYLVSAITTLRNAWYRVSDSEKPQIAYVLGKAYYQRGYYFADLAVKYLDYAWKAGVEYEDLAEFRGLASSLLGDYETGIASFLEALAVKPSDLLLYTLAQNYLRIEDTEKAKQYFLETIRTTGDELLQLKCRYNLGTVFLMERKVDEAKAEFDTILEKDPNSADAHYGLGVIYETQGDPIRSRAEWRKAIRINPVHPGARAKLNL